MIFRPPGYRPKAVAQFLLVNLLLMLLAASTASQPIVPDSMALQADSALQAAAEVTGFGERMPGQFILSSKLVSASLEIVRDTITPYLYEQVDGRAVWVVHVDSVDTRPAEAIARDDDRWPRRSFDIWVDPENWTVLRIWSRPDSATCATPDEPAAALATETMREAGEIYHTVPEERPKATFIEALSASPGCMPLVADEIIGFNTVYSRLDNDKRHVWVIVTRGVPPPQKFGVTSRGMSDDDCSGRQRCVVDAETGVWVFQTTHP